jgi:hypothetical protein
MGLSVHRVEGVEQRMKPLPTLLVSAKLWLHPDMHIWAPPWARGHQEYKSGGHLEL